MPNYSKSLKRIIEKRVKDKELNISDQKAGLRTTASTLANMQALGRLKARKMNKTELAYSNHLNALKLSGEVVWYEFESIKLRLADNTYYNPDFLVMLSSGALQVHEVKGYMMDDANVKIKVAAESFPFPFFVVRKGKAGQWNITEVGNKR